jgi:signal transduction histidine kinase
MEAEEARFRTIIQTTTDALVIVDHGGAVRFVNAAAEHLFGRPAGELLGEPFGLPVVVGETTEVDIVRPGSTVVAELRASEIDWEGAPAAIASLRNITERKRAEERERTLIREQVARVEAEASERRARFLAEVGSALADSLDYNLTLKRLAHLAVPFLGDWCVVDVIEEDGSIRRVAVDCADPAHSDLAADIKALPTEHNVLLGVSRILRDRRGELIAELTPEHLERLSAVPERAELIRRITPNSAMVVPLVARGRPLGAILLASAQSQRTYKERDLEFAEEVAWRAAIAVDNARLYQEAQLANKAKADFLAIMSHELRTPLNAVIGYSDLLLMGVPAEIPTPAVAHVNRIRGSARHLLRLIEEILTYARMEAGREQLDIQEFDSETVIREVIVLIEPLALDRKLELVCRLPDNQVTLNSDPGKLQQVLLNLLSNAVKFTDKGEVGLEFKVEGQTAQFVVWDMGSASAGKARATSSSRSGKPSSPGRGGPRERVWASRSRAAWRPCWAETSSWILRWREEPASLCISRRASCCPRNRSNDRPRQTPGPIRRSRLIGVGWERTVGGGSVGGGGAGGGGGCAYWEAC